MAGMEVVAGVDIGSSAARAVAVDRRGEVVSTARAGYRPACLPVGEADPAVWLEGLRDAFHRLECGAPIALGIGGQSPTTVASTGQRALTFRHPAGAAEGPAGQHLAHAALLEKRYGPRVFPRLMWDFLISRLGGYPSFHSVWPEAAPLDGFGDPLPVGSYAGVTSGEYGIPPGITLAPGDNDASMTAWAAAVDAPGKGFDPGGRTGGLGVAVGMGKGGRRPEFGLACHVSGVYIVGGPVASHGAVMDWWAGITGRAVPDLIEEAASVEPGAGGVMVLPFLEGERAPRWKQELRAEILGLGLEAGAGAVTRAILESTAYGLAHIARGLAEQGVQLHRVTSCGGPSRSSLWTSIKASALGVPFDVPACREMAAYGAALAAGSAAGWWPRPGEGAKGSWPTPPVTVYEPDPELYAFYRNETDRFIALGDEAEARLERGTIP